MSVAAVWAGEVGGESGRRVRIAIVSPEIVARIRHAFASKGLDVRIDRLPMLELTIGPGGGASPAAAAFADALGRLVGPVSRERQAASARYQLSLLGLGDVAEGGEAEGSEAGGRRGRVVAAERGGGAVGRAVTVVVGRGESGAGADGGGIGGGEGRRGLSPREVEVMSCISLGMMNPDIAERLGVSQKTVKNHVNHIFGKLGARSRVEAVLIWQNVNSGVGVGVGANGERGAGAGG